MDQTVSLEKEDRMPFDSSVCVKTGDNTKREVKSVRGASEVLVDWPHARRGPVYQSTMEVLETVLKGNGSTAEAYDAFVAFAKHAGVFVDT